MWLTVIVIWTWTIKDTNAILLAYLFCEHSVAPSGGHWPPLAFVGSKRLVEATDERWSSVLDSGYALFYMCGQHQCWMVASGGFK